MLVLREPKTYEAYPGKRRPPVPGVLLVHPWFLVGLLFTINIQSSTVQTIMEQITPDQKTFTCQLCGLSTAFTYYGQKPPNTRAIVLLEECFVTKDPFSPDREKFLVLGSRCSLCGVSACVGSDCSLFYTARFCMRCVNGHLDQFPTQIRAELAKKKPTSKPAVP